MKLAFWQRDRQRSIEGLSFEEWLSYFSYQGNQYTLGLNQTMAGQSQELIGGDFRSLAGMAYKRNGVVFACMLVRMLLFSEARFQFRQLRSGRPGDYFGTQDLASLERPWPGGTTGDLLARAIQDVDLAGNFFAVRRPGGRIRRLRPDWVTIVLGSLGDDSVQAGDVDAEVLGYLYQPGGPGSGRTPETYLRDQVAHFAPIPDPEASFRGMSWITPVIRDVMGDLAATQHKLEFFENGATPNMVVMPDPSIRNPDQFKQWVDMIRASHEGPGNRYKTMFLGHGADATVVGANFQQIDFKATQGAGETRIAAAAGVPPVIVGLSEGLQGSSLNEGNYAMARRRLVDMTMRPLWRNFAGSMSMIVPSPAGAELWYDDRDIPALREDGKDAADILEVQSRAIKGLVESGFDPSSAVDAVMAGDLRRLAHTGMLSVQMQKPGENGSLNGGGAKLELPAPVEE